jgi:hypothetical protein
VTAPSEAVVPVVWARDGRRTAYAPGALDVLRTLTPGRTLSLLRCDGRRQPCTVLGVGAATAPEAQDAVEVDDRAGELTLTVCGGPYDPATGGYLGSVVVRCAIEPAASSAPSSTAADPTLPTTSPRP